MQKHMSLAVVILLVLAIAFNLSIVAAQDEESDFSYFQRDLTTRGSWNESQYGDCGYALPYAKLKSTQIPIGARTGIGEPAHEFWWRTPWSVPGKKYYPYEDYRGGYNILEYNVTGPEGPPRALVNAAGYSYRPTWYCHDSSITITLKEIETGNYNLSIYFLDWNATLLWKHRRLEVSVASGGSWASAQLGVPSGRDNFAAGIYAIFRVEVTDGTIEIEVESLWTTTNAVVSGIFLNKITDSAAGVDFFRFDRETMGNWRPSYGKNYHLLAGFGVPSTGVSLPMDKSYDVTNIIDYEVSDGVCQYAGDDARTYGGYPYIGQYAAYAWTLPLNQTASDPRVLIYPEVKLYPDYPPPLNDGIYGQWDSGEFVGPLNYLVIRLKIPEGGYILSIYAMDWARASRSETIEIWDESMTTLLDSQHVTSEEINNGVYVQWLVQGPRIVNIKVIADTGNLNSFIDGIFLNCLLPRRIGGVQVPMNKFEPLDPWSGKIPIVMSTVLMVSTVLAVYARLRKKQQK